MSKETLSVQVNFTLDGCSMLTACVRPESCLDEAAALLRRNASRGRPVIGTMVAYRYPRRGRAKEVCRFDSDLGYYGLGRVTSYDKELGSSRR